MDERFQAVSSEVAASLTNVETRSAHKAACAPVDTISRTASDAKSSAMSTNPAPCALADVPRQTLSSCSNGGRALPGVATDLDDPMSHDQEGSLEPACSAQPTSDEAGLEPPVPALKFRFDSDEQAVKSSGLRRSRTFSSSSDVDVSEWLDREAPDAEPGLKKARASTETSSFNVVAANSTKPAQGGRGLRSEGKKDVEGFETCGLWVARCSKKLPKTQSWCFVPLIFSALGNVPEWLRQEGVSSLEQIEEAQPVWSKLFSHWAVWRDELRRVIDAYGVERFQQDFLPRTFGQKSWTTSLVYGEPRIFGRLPHPPGPKQDKIIAMLPCDTQNQIFASVAAIACK